MRPDIPVSFRGPARLALALIFATLGLFVLWGAFAPINSGAIAPGEIIPDGRTKTIQHLEGGIVRSIQAKDGVRVAAGDLLLELDETIARAQLAIAMSDEAAQAALVRRLLAEREGKPLPRKTADGRSADNQARIFEGRRDALRKDIEGLRQRVLDTEEELAGWKAKSAQLELQLAHAEEESRINQGLYRQNFISRPRLLQLESRKAEVAGAMAETVAEAARARQKISEAKAAIEKLSHDWHNSVLDEVQKAQEGHAAAIERLNVAKDRLQRTRIVAPQDGVVNGMRYTTVGAVIPPGGVIMEITPSTEQLVVEARLSPDDIDVVRSGLDARVRLTAYKVRRHFTLKGHVRQVSSDTFKDEKSGLSYYKLQVEIPDTELQGVDKMTLIPGMLAQVEVVTGERTALRYLLDPVVDSMHRAMKEK